MKEFLKYVLANFVAFAVIAGIGMVLFFLFLGSLMLSGQPTVVVPSRAVLVLNLASPVVDKPVSEDFSTFMEDVQGRRIHKMSLHDVLDGLDQAANDERIKALYITGNVSETSWASLSEIREAVLRFKEKKKVLAYNQIWQETDYFVASAANEVLIHPDGLMELNGMATEIMYWKDAFEKYGVDIQVTRVGKYKAAVEPYMLNQMSAENREQLETLLGDLFGYFLDTIATTRKVEVAALRTLADTQALVTAQMATDQGLVDRIVHYDEVLTGLADLVGEQVDKDFQAQISIRKYVEALSLEPQSHSGDKVLVVYVEGNIVDGTSDEQAGGDEIAAHLRRARFDDSVKAVVLRVNSPGGTVSASEVMGREARLLREVKPVVVSMGGQAASGGYWIAAHADEIFALPNTITGSIGVFGMFTNVQELMNTHGLKVEVAKTSVMADTLTLVRPKTEAELANLQLYVDGSYEQFINLVAEGRKMDPVKVHEIAQGRVWAGSRAKELGLVDSLGGLNQAVEAAAKRANLTEWRWHHYQQPKEFAEELVELMEDREQYISGPVGPMQQAVISLEKNLKQLALFDKPMQTYAMLPFQLNIR